MSGGAVRRRAMGLGLGLVSGLVACVGVARADAAFTGMDAALIDWGVKNCGLKSTAAEHALVEAANGKSRDTFNRQYMQQFQSEAFTAAATDKAKRDHLCRDLKEWYGRSGTRISHLLASDSEGAQPDQPPRRASPSDAGGGKGGGHGGRGHSGGL